MQEMWKLNQVSKIATFGALMNEIGCWGLFMVLEVICEHSPFYRYEPVMSDYKLQIWTFLSVANISSISSS